MKIIILSFEVELFEPPYQQNYYWNFYRFLLHNMMINTIFDAEINKSLIEF